MNKKKYQTPIAKIICVETSDIIATSTGATGEDAPWATSRRGFTFGNDDLDEDV